MLINLSNHPSDKWSGAQRTTAEKAYGTIQDMPFPNINPAATPDEIYQLAAQYCNQIRATNAITVHLMGEMTFTFCLVKMLQAIGITCYAATSERNSIDNADGTKTIQFDFVQFRRY
jgi:hypothetical protein